MIPRIVKYTESERTLGGAKGWGSGGGEGEWRSQEKDVNGVEGGGGGGAGGGAEGTGGLG